MQQTYIISFGKYKHSGYFLGTLLSLLGRSPSSYTLIVYTLEKILR